MEFLDILNLKKSLSSLQSEQLANWLLSEKNSDTQKKEVLSSLYEKGESQNELLGFIKTLKSRMIQLDLKVETMDICGTGGSGKNRFNTSSAVAFVLASLGIPIVKHGNRGSKKANGSFDFLEALGISFDHTVSQQKILFKKHNLCFCFAKTHHPDMKYVAKARSLLNHRSIFNLLGPLLNPANASTHLLGVSNSQTFNCLKDLLPKLGYKHILLILGHNNLDEANITGKNHCLSIKGNNSSAFEIDPEALGVYEKTLPEIENAKESASLFIAIMNEPKSYPALFKLICLNAGLALYTYGKTISIQSGLSSAMIAFESGLVKDYFDRFKKETTLS